MIFLSYVSEDRSRVLPFYELLDSHGLNPWMDCKNILGGQNWDYEIKTALDRSDIVVQYLYLMPPSTNAATRKKKLSWRLISTKRSLLEISI